MRDLRHRFFWSVVVAFLIAVLPTSTALAADFALIAATGQPVGDSVVLVWPMQTITGRPASGYSVHRRTADGDWLDVATNLKPLTDCAAIETVLGKGSDDWKTIEVTLGNLPGRDTSLPFNVCSIGSLMGNPTQTPSRILRLLAQSRWKIAVAIGLGFEDTTTTGQETYWYKVVAAASSGSAVATSAEAKITAGKFVSPAPPSPKAQARDAMVMIHWDAGSGGDAVGYDVKRQDPSTDTFIVNPGRSIASPAHDLDGQTFSKTTSGFVDALRWEDGDPASHDVDGTQLMGPKNGQTYTYLVRAYDLLGRPGGWSSAVSAKPQDMTPPVQPDLVATARDGAGEIVLSTAAVFFDEKGRREDDPEKVSYSFYRYEDPNAKPEAGKLLAPNGLMPQVETAGNPPVDHLLAVEYADVSGPTNPLRPAYGEKVFWYRVRCVDAAGNASPFSGPTSTHLKDITPPPGPEGLTADGADASITIGWTPLPEAIEDVNEYIVYRSLCHLASLGYLEPDYWVPPDTSYGGPSEAEWVEVGHLSHTAAVKDGAIIVDDFTEAIAAAGLESGPPICFAYTVRAMDRAQNRSTLPPKREGVWYVCERLRDTAPPDGALITSLEARDGGVEIQWMAPPVQDIRGYALYRAASEEAFTGSGSSEKPEFVAFFQVPDVKTPSKPTRPLTCDDKPVPGSQARPSADTSCICAEQEFKTEVANPRGCDVIPLDLWEGMSSGWFLDANVPPKDVYWYVAAGVDESGNVTPLRDCVPVSTFTFSTLRPMGTENLTVQPAGGGLRIGWTPAFDKDLMLGFLLYRSDTETGTYVQVGSLIRGNSYDDVFVQPGGGYWYRVLWIGSDGRLSEPSKAVKGTAE